MTSRRSFLRTVLGSIASVAMAVYVPRFVVEEQSFDTVSIYEGGFWKSGELEVLEITKQDLQRMVGELAIVRPPQPLIVTYDEYVLLGGNR